MPFTINRVRAVAANDAGFSDLVGVLPEVPTDVLVAAGPRMICLP